MATSPPANLKERIAALQQRSVSPNTHQSAQASPRGLPSPGTGRLRDKIAKFEEKGGVPVPRGSFAMGTPQLAENAPPKKRGELYGNRVPLGLGRPSGAPAPSPSESPGPRKRCISTGAALSTGPSKFATDEPVPALPNGRRNSLAVHVDSGRRVMSTSSGDTHPPPLLDVAESPADRASPEPDDPPTPQNHPFPVHDAFVDQASNDGQSDYDSAPQPAVSQLSASSVPIDTPPAPAPAPAETVVAPPSGDVTKQGDPVVSVPPNIPTSVPIDTPSTVTPARAETVVASSPEDVTKQGDPIVSVLPNTPTSSVSIDTPSTVTPARAETVVAPPSGDVQGSVIATPASDPVVSVLTTEACPQSKPTFKAVVHRKVTRPAASSLDPSAIPQLTQQRRGVSGNVVEVPPSPGYGDLAVLLEDAALLELRLTEGDGTNSKAKELLAATPTTATFQPDPRHASASTLTEHVSVPSVDSGSQSMRSVSIPSIREPLYDGEIPEGDETDGRSLASTTFSQRSPSHRKYLSNIYRLTGRRSSSYMPGAYPRDSMSMSSEDSSPVTTPSDNGKRKGFGIAWPSASPKKGGPNAGRSSSFADKIFNRNRTRSNVSTADQASERNSIYESSQPTLSLSFPSELSPESHPDGEDAGARPASWISPGDSNSEFSPASSLLDKDIFDAFPSVPQTLPPGYHLGAENASMGRASTLPVNGRKQVNQRLSMA